jgi:hypothetical protein
MVNEIFEIFHAALRRASLAQGHSTRLRSLSAASIGRAEGHEPFDRLKAQRGRVEWLQR